MTSGNQEFTKKILKYYMEFLETDFHKRNLPKRRIQNKDNNGSTISIDIRKFDVFSTQLFQSIRDDITKVELKINRNEYQIQASQKNIDRIFSDFYKNFQKVIDNLNRNIIKSLESINSQELMSVESKIERIIDSVREDIKKEISDIFVTNSSKELQNIGLITNHFYSLSEAISENIYEVLEKRLLEIFDEIAENKNQLVSYFISMEDIYKSISSSISAFGISDLFHDLTKISQSKNIHDKQELYLSVFHLEYQGVKYPILYLPAQLEINSENSCFKLNIDSIAYINRKGIEFIRQETKDLLQLTGSIESIQNRINYLSGKDFDFFVKSILNEICNYFSLDHFTDDNLLRNQRVGNDVIKFENSIHLCLFDKSDDAIINDYEEILQLFEKDTENELVNSTSTLIDSFISKEPKSFESEIESDWDKRTASEKLTYQAPISLNSEQLQIIDAINKPDCKFLTIQGPPGTGKSHTITAILFEMIMKNKSVLLLSDKKEALDVVEDKIVSTLNIVRQKDDFQNPILRLGKSGSTYSKILSNQSLIKIKNFHKSSKNKTQEIEESISNYYNKIECNIEKEKDLYASIDISKILDLLKLESEIELNYGFDVEEIDTALLEKKLLLDLANFIVSLQDNDIIDALKLMHLTLSSDDKLSIKDLTKIRNKYHSTIMCLKKMNHEINDYILPFKRINPNTVSKIKVIKDSFLEWNEVENRFLSFIYRGKFFKKVKRKLVEEFGLDVSDIQQDVKSIIEIYKLFSRCVDFDANDLSDNVKIINFLMQFDNSFEKVNRISFVFDRHEEIMNALLGLPKNFSKLNWNNLSRFNSSYSTRDIDSYNTLFDIIDRRRLFGDIFRSLSISDYLDNRKNLQENLILKMTNILDSRVLDYYENNKNSATNLRAVIQKKLKFPKEEFDKLRLAFPCILSSIRDFAEFIPLEYESFDLLIIDEASQVSIAQAIPAIIRAKKVIVLGDKKQFSNVKTSQAKTEINNEYMNQIKESFKETTYNQEYLLTKIEKFNIKSSIIDFFEHITNYSTMLNKHFRGYKEIISYSNKFFYGNQLQVMKIRGKSIDEVIKIHVLEHDGKLEPIKNTNSIEITFIINELEKLKQDSILLSVGIITPHTNQQKKIIEEIDKNNSKSYFYETLKLKVMTFDTCQGEERDIIYFSMVATKNSDSLFGIFPKDLSKLDLEEEGNLRAQRLNVGFSRAKERMEIVLSKDPMEFTNEIRNAILHYSDSIIEARSEKSSLDVDKKSPMETHVLDWFYKTEFWNSNKNIVEIYPQFNLGEYLKQTDPTYKHPKYKVDFFVNYKRSESNNERIIIEYDGFKEHFTNLSEVNSSNFDSFYKEDDIYRQKTIESYGYKFLRINRFNVGKNPVVELDKRLNQLLETNTSQNNPIVTSVVTEAAELGDGKKKQCPKCNEIQLLEEFQDSDGHSKRYCKKCRKDKELQIIEERKLKKKIAEENKLSKKAPKTNRNYKSVNTVRSNICPKCGGVLVKKHGVYGYFIGCSKYPRCKYTRNL